MKEYRIEFKGHKDCPGDEWYCHANHIGSLSTAKAISKFAAEYSPTNEARILVRDVTEWRVMKIKKVKP